MHFEMNEINDIVFSRIDRRANINVRIFSRVFIPCAITIDIVGSQRWNSNRYNYYRIVHSSRFRRNHIIQSFDDISPSHQLIFPLFIWTRTSDYDVKTHFFSYEFNWLTKRYLIRRKEMYTYAFHYSDQTIENLQNKSCWNIKNQWLLLLLLW